MKRYQFNKLIRSKLQDRMKKEGVIVNSTHLNHDQYIHQLKNKIIEEAKEVMEAKTLDNLITELADVMEVIYAVAEVYKINILDIEAARVKKRDVNGYFTANDYVNYIDVALDNHQVIEYLENKDRPYVNAITIIQDNKEVEKI
ncbi:MAG: hypothetical protein EKK61_01930 [Rickettsiales bacterium]|nr:MAG: hypothetical protein EKK61_01930 [Rickettsiales bacterium]